MSILVCSHTKPEPSPLTTTNFTLVGIALVPPPGMMVHLSFQTWQGCAASQDPRRVRNFLLVHFLLSFLSPQAVGWQGLLFISALLLVLGTSQMSNQHLLNERMNSRHTYILCSLEALRLSFERIMLLPCERWGI